MSSSYENRVAFADGGQAAARHRGADARTTAEAAYLNCVLAAFSFSRGYLDPDPFGQRPGTTGEEPCCCASAGERCATTLVDPSSLESTLNASVHFSRCTSLDRSAHQTIWGFITEAAVGRVVITRWGPMSTPVTRAGDTVRALGRSARHHRHLGATTFLHAGRGVTVQVLPTDRGDAAIDIAREVKRSMRR